MRLISMICAGLIAATPAVAQDREALGNGRLFSNDFFGDNEDRWRTGSFAYSNVRGPQWQGRAPVRPGALLEYRLRTEIIAPEELDGPQSADRAYVGALSAGVHTHFTRGSADVALGLDIVAVGPQTGMAGLQDSFHDLVGAPNLAGSVKADQIENAFYPTALGEVGFPIAVGETATIRPFVEAQYGVENYVRVGADVMIGDILKNDLWLRDSSTGQLYTGVQTGGAGAGFVFGADYALVDESEYFPASFGTQAEDDRFRARAGIHWRSEGSISYFYGMTYLSEEYVGQDGGQFVGSLKLDFNF